MNVNGKDVRHSQDEEAEYRGRLREHTGNGGEPKSGLKKVFSYTVRSNLWNPEGQGQEPVVHHRSSC